MIRAERSLGIVPAKSPVPLQGPWRLQGCPSEFPPCTLQVSCGFSSRAICLWLSLQLSKRHVILFLLPVGLPGRGFPGFPGNKGDKGNPHRHTFLSAGATTVGEQGLLSVGLHVPLSKAWLMGDL